MVDVSYADWMIGDGEPPPRPGSLWTAMIELHVDGPESPEYWYPELTPLDRPEHSLLEPVQSSRPGVHRFEAATVKVVDNWTVLEADGARFGVVGSYSDGASGVGRFVHDTYFMTPGARDAVRTELLVATFERVSDVEWIVRCTTPGGRGRKPGHEEG